MNSLIPAAARGVELALESRTAHISVAADQLSLAIGRGGENARLAARLTGWRIDIRGDEPQESGEESDQESADTESGDAAPAEG
jgi:N utilization substance protein A